MQINYADPSNQKSNPALGIGVEALDFIKNAEQNHLRQSRLPDFYGKVRKFYVEVAGYLLKSLPWEDNLLKAISVVDMDRQVSAQDEHLLHLLRRFPSLMRGIIFF